MAGGMRPKAWMVGLFLFMVYNFGLMVVLHYSGAINDGFLNETSAHEHIAPGHGAHVRLRRSVPAAGAAGAAGAEGGALAERPQLVRELVPRGHRDV